MGAMIFLVPRSDEFEKEDRYDDLIEERNCSCMSEAFMTFVDGKQNNSEFSQVEKLLNIDLSVYRNLPENIHSDVIFNLEAELFNAENEKVNLFQIKSKIEDEQNRIDKEAKESLEGWTSISEMKKTTELLIEKYFSFSNLDKLIESSYENYWENYFNNGLESADSEFKFEKDLKALICELDCMDKAGYEYVCLAID